MAAKASCDDSLFEMRLGFATHWLRAWWYEGIVNFYRLPKAELPSPASNKNEPHSGRASHLRQTSTFFCTKVHGGEVGGDIPEHCAARSLMSPMSCCRRRKFLQRFLRRFYGPTGCR